MADQIKREENTAIPAAAETAGAEILETTGLLQVLKNYGRPILLGLGVAVVVFLSITVYRSRQTQTAAEASRMVATGNADQLRAVIAQYPTTSAAAAAALALAHQAYGDGRYEEALALYKDFSTAHPDHPMALSAKLNVAVCLESLGKTGEALAAFREFKKDHADYFLAAEAIFGEARCLEAQGQCPQARALYEDYRAAHPDSRWNRIAETAVEALDAKIRAAQQAVTPKP